MSSGGNYVSAPYSAVAAYSVDGTNTIPSGATIVQGVYYMWDEQGFISTGWHADMFGSPINSGLGNVSNDEVLAYIADPNRGNGTLDPIFANWNPDMNAWDVFYNAVPLGCKTVTLG